jgi:hypothetical protein
VATRAKRHSAAADAEAAHDIVVDPLKRSAITVLASTKEKRVCRRSRPRMEVWAKRTPFSTFALSFGRRSRAGRNPSHNGRPPKICASRCGLDR